MMFSESNLKGAFIIDPERLEDERGFFARTWCQREFEAHGLTTRWVQCNISFNKSKGTLRGMHYQVAPYEEAKLVRCTSGAIYDVIIDLRPASVTFTQHLAVVLTAQDRRMLYIPEGFAHGFQTLEDNTEVFYQMSEFYVPEFSRGVRWDDPAFGIQWPEDERVISERDRNYRDFSERRLPTRDELDAAAPRHPGPAPSPRRAEGRTPAAGGPGSAALTGISPGERSVAPPAPQFPPPQFRHPMERAFEIPRSLMNPEYGVNP